MSTTFSIGCTACRRKLWIGQTSCGGPLSIYGESALRPTLASFLTEHQGRQHPLIFDSDHFFEHDEDGPAWLEQGEADDREPRHDSQSEEAIASRAIQAFSAQLAPLHLPTFFWVGLPKTNDSLLGGSRDMAPEVKARLFAEMMHAVSRLPETPEGPVEG